MSLVAETGGIMGVILGPVAKKKLGKLGCSDFYIAFRKVLLPLLKKRISSLFSILILILVCSILMIYKVYILVP